MISGAFVPRWISIGVFNRPTGAVAGAFQGDASELGALSGEEGDVVPAGSDEFGSNAGNPPPNITGFGVAQFGELPVRRE